MFEAMRFIFGFIVLTLLTSMLANWMRGADVQTVVLCVLGILVSIWGFFRVCIGPVIKL